VGGTSGKDRLAEELLRHEKEGREVGVGGMGVVGGVKWRGGRDQV
jgi:hypothetical protein